MGYSKHCVSLTEVCESQSVSCLKCVVTLEYSGTSLCPVYKVPHSLGEVTAQSAHSHPCSCAVPELSLAMWGTAFSYAKSYSSSKTLAWSFQHVHFLIFIWKKYFLIVHLVKILPHMFYFFKVWFWCVLYDLNTTCFVVPGALSRVRG